MIVSNRHISLLSPVEDMCRVVCLVMLISNLPLLVPSAAAESNYCAFEVKVSEPSGAAAAGVPVLMFRKGEIMFSETTTDKSGVARLCDAPLAPVNIVVGFDMCGSVVVRVMRQTWPETQTVFVTYARTFCAHVPIQDRCQVLLRIQDEKGRPLAGARLEGAPATSSESDVSDVFGRLFRSIKAGEKLEGAVVKEGWRPARVSHACIEHDEDDIELKVVLSK